MIQTTRQGDGSADMTVTLDECDHKFSVSPDGDTGVVTYQESQIGRGQIVVSDPKESVWKKLMQSDEMTAYLESQNLQDVRRNR
jgi:hypothetical protein